MVTSSRHRWSRWDGGGLVQDGDEGPHMSHDGAGSEAVTRWVPGNRTDISVSP